MLARGDTTLQPLLLNERSNDTFAAEPVKYQLTKSKKIGEGAKGGVGGRGGQT